MTAIDTIKYLDPMPLWRHFAEICSIPHPSGQETALIEHIERFCAEKGVACRSDSRGNLLLEKHATLAELPCAPKVVLQAHLDMVAQAVPEKKHDFTNDPITPLVDDGWVRAAGTTLGADNGIGVAAILAVFESKEIPHGPLSAVLTVEEETGLSGAGALSAKFLDGDILLNLDSEEFGEFCVSCAGGCETTFVLNGNSESISPNDWSFFKLTVAGFEGGHSGVDIHLGRGNAIQTAAAVLSRVAAETETRLFSIDGGSVSNAIPRETEALFAVPSADSGHLAAQVDSISAIALADLFEDPNASISLAPYLPLSSAMPAVVAENVLEALSECQNGVMSMSEELPGIVETSSNIGAVKTANGGIKVSTMQRSLKERDMLNLRAEIADNFNLHGFTAEYGDSFPPWEPSRNSRILKLCEESFESLFGWKPVARAIHAGLECGVFGRLNPNLDMISFGPTIKYPHSPNERVDIASVADFWCLLTGVLAASATSKRFL